MALVMRLSMHGHRRRSRPRYPLHHPLTVEAQRKVSTDGHRDEDRVLQRRGRPLPLTECHTVGGGLTCAAGDSARCDTGVEG